MTISLKGNQLITESETSKAISAKKSLPKILTKYFPRDLHISLAMSLAGEYNAYSKYSRFKGTVLLVS